MSGIRGPRSANWIVIDDMGEVPKPSPEKLNWWYEKIQKLLKKKS